MAPAALPQRLLVALAAIGAFTQWRLSVLRHSIRIGKPVGPLWLPLLVTKVLRLWSWLMGVTVKSESGAELVDQSRRYMITWHPHGFIVYCPIFLLAEKSIVGDPIGKPWHCTGAPVLFNVPIMGDTLQVLNGRPVDKKSLESIMGQGGTVAVQPGGMAEQKVTTHEQEQAMFPANLGFIRMAIKYGTPLLIVYIFGENQLFRRVSGFERLTEMFFKLSGMALPLFVGKAGLPVSGLTPRATDVHVRWGAPVEVGEPDANPSDDKVEEVFQRYLSELCRVFYANAQECLPPDVAARGLKIIRLDRKPVPEFAASDRPPVARSRL
uniref:Acyltransferase n=1 Tax=Zooxanthella nutricula TaxID=1333877 RepID=A0A7S2QN10_9DINO